MKPLLVGEDNPYSDDPSDALLPWPRGASGDRLRNILGLVDATYLDRYDRANLCVGFKWKLRDAQSAARFILDQRMGKKAVVVLLGAKVRAAFSAPGLTFESVILSDGTTLVLLPHPSGMNRAWNDPEAQERAREVMRKVGAL